MPFVEIASDAIHPPIIPRCIPSSKRRELSRRAVCHRLRCLCRRPDLGNIDGFRRCWLRPRCRLFHLPQPFRGCQFLAVLSVLLRACRSFLSWFQYDQMRVFAFIGFPKIPPALTFTGVNPPVFSINVLNFG